MKKSELFIGKIVHLNTSAIGHQEDDHKPAKIVSIGSVKQTNYHGKEFYWLGVELDNKTSVYPSNRVY